VVDGVVGSGGGGGVTHSSSESDVRTESSLVDMVVASDEVAI